MQYDLKKDVTENKVVAVEWHGDDTLVAVKKGEAKTKVVKGQVLKVSIELARTLLKYSHLWTLKGDKPTEHAFDKARKAMLDRVENVAEEGGNENKKSDGALTEKEVVMKELTELGVNFNEAASLDELVQLRDASLNV